MQKGKIPAQFRIGQVALIEAERAINSENAVCQAGIKERWSIC